MSTQFYALKFGLNSSTNQGELLQSLKSVGDEAIQTSDGLCLATNRGADDLRQWLKEKGAEGINVQSIDVETATNDEGTSPDVKAFLNRSADSSTAAEA